MLNFATSRKRSTFRKKGEISYRRGRHIIARNRARNSSGRPQARCNVEIVNVFGSTTPCNAASSKYSDTRNTRGSNMAPGRDKRRSAPGGQGVTVYVHDVEVCACGKQEE